MKVRCFATYFGCTRKQMFVSKNTQIEFFFEKYFRNFVAEIYFLIKYKILCINILSVLFCFV